MYIHVKHVNLKTNVIVRLPYPQSRSGSSKSILIYVLNTYIVFV